MVTNKNLQFVGTNNGHGLVEVGPLKTKIAVPLLAYPLVLCLATEACLPVPKLRLQNTKTPTTLEVVVVTERFFNSGHTLKKKSRQIFGKKCSNDSNPRTNTNTWVYSTQKLKSMHLNFQNELVYYSMCPGPPTPANNTSKSDGQGRVLYFMYPFIFKPRRILPIFVKSICKYSYLSGGWLVYQLFCDNSQQGHGYRCKKPHNVRGDVKELGCSVERYTAHGHTCTPGC